MRSNLKLNNISKKFGDREILSGINLEVKQGERVCIIGPSGAGKTTLLRCVSLLDVPDIGYIEFNNEISVKDGFVLDASNIRNNVFMVFQNFNLWEHKSVLENVIEGLVVVKKMPKKGAVKIGITLLERLGLKGSLDKYPFSLSSGEKQRVAIARSLAMKPSLLLLDEATSALDTESVSNILSLIKELSKNKTSVIMVTHEIGFAKRIADKIVFLDKGSILDSGKPLEILNNPKNKRIREFLVDIIK